MSKLSLKSITHADVYYAGLILMAIALPCSVFLMSVAQLILGINWFWERKYKEKFQLFFTNKVAIVVLSLYLLHIIGLLWTSDFDYAFKDLRVKLPFLIFPIILSTTPPLSQKRFVSVLLFFISSVVVCSFISVYVWLTRIVIDVRSISIFISHIRFSLMIDLSVFILAFLLLRKNEFSFKIKALFFITIFWLIVFLFILESFTGLIILITTSVLIMISYILFLKNKAWVKLTTILLITGIVLGVVFFVKSVRSDYNYRFPEDMNRLDLRTSKGNPYINLIEDNHYENGYKLGIYMCPQELEETWNKKSKIKYNQNDATGQKVMYTLVRFLTSKGYRKDADGVNKLTNEEILAIERGVANYKYMDKFNIRNRVYQTFWEYDDYMDGRNPNNHSLMQRLEFWKASIGIIKFNWLIGVGTGDLPDAFKSEYIKMKSSLEEKQRWRSHNQYLSITVAFGSFGFLLFLVFLFYPAIKTKKIKNYYFLVFLIITMLSMIAEDTIESQPGASFVALFYCLFIFAQGTEFSTTFEKKKFADEKN